MFYLRTGTPGAGKTLSLIDELRQVKDRPIFYFGIPGLKLDWQLIKDPQNYHNEIPDGSIFVLDECQQHFPVRPPKDSVPPGISFLETHRHRGIDVYFITQHPSLLDHHARRLVGQHVHLQRNFGMSRAVKYTNNKLFDFTNYHELQTCQKSQYIYPKDVFDLYKSAEIHTHKRKLPKKLLLLIPLLLMVLGGIYLLYNTLFVRDVSIVPQYHNDSTFSADSIPVSNSQVVKRDWKTAYIPVVPGLPHTAPLYDKLTEPQTFPVVTMCWSSQTECHCYSQQATKIDMPDNLCRQLVKDRSFNPFKLAKLDTDKRTKKERQKLNDQ